MHTPAITIIYFFYGLAFFSMGLVLLIEGGRGVDIRLQRALRPLMGFGLIHGIHEWIEMFHGLGFFPRPAETLVFWEALDVALLAFSFLSLAAFGALLLSPTEEIRRISLIFPLVLAGVWGFGSLILNGFYIEGRLWAVVHVWTRYVIGIPSALVAAWGLISQQKIFRKAGMVGFGQDSLWAAVAFGWYGLVGQVFGDTSPLPPSSFLNQDLFFELFGFPVQLVRAVAACVAAFFVIRFLRSFDLETQQQIEELRDAQIKEARRSEALKGELLRRVVSAQEAERQRISRELHDETGQALTAIGLGLRGVSTILSRDLDRASSNLQELEEMALNSLNELRRLISDLRPSHLDDLGLGPALRWYGHEVQNRTSLVVNVTAPGGKCPIPKAVSMTLFRIAQEALNNVIKHAVAKEARILVGQEQNNIIMEVIDNGEGFDPKKLVHDQKETWGLIGMEERVSLLGGKFQIDSSPGMGTRVKVSIPCSIGDSGEVKND